MRRRRRRRILALGGLLLVAAAVIAGVIALNRGSSTNSTEADTLARLRAENAARRAEIAKKKRELAAQRAQARRHVKRTATTTTAPRPQIVQRPIPFSEKRKQEMTAYAERHYGIDTYRLSDPKVIVEHYTATPDAQSAINTFSADVPDPELHELPGTCAHFVIDTDGTIYQLVPLDIMCRHTVGLNYTSIGIEHAGTSDQEILSNAAQMHSSLALTRWLRCRFGIPVADVIGHNESLTSPYHRENVPSLRTQTHGDWVKADMDIYRRKLAQLTC